MDEYEIHEDHGHSVAAWATVCVVLLGALVAGIGVAMASMPVAIVGGVICVAGLVLGKVLSMAGYGVKPRDVNGALLVDTSKH